MGILIWHDWAHFVAIAASVYTVWSSFFGLIYRKFFWDFVNGIIRNPGGVQPANQDKIFITLIVKAPIIQILAMVTGIFILSLELPNSPLKNTSLSRSFVPKIVLLAWQAFLTILYYQSGDLLFFESTIHSHQDEYAKFEIRLCPALQQKPHSPTLEKKKDDPFAAPYIPKLFVAEAKAADEDFVVILNKYSVVPKHFLLITKAFKSQSSPLSPPELLQTYLLLLAAQKAGERYIAFFNCGRSSGASQPHKHIQFLPVDEDGPPIEKLARSQVVEKAAEPFSIGKLPYANFLYRLPESLRSSSEEGILNALSEAFLQLLDLCISSMRRSPDIQPGPPSYNFILTLDHMHLIPRSKEEHILAKTGEPLNVNSLGFAGMLLVKDEAELEALKEEGVTKILRNVGLPRDESNEEEDE
ncbi:hypothetical protein M422DRAFT_74641 [Sphaerobolus stellatus SS14]|nr:hypothetical protein M422DRAFT_74641 [Sphaerobolus stellatus SS14]